MEEFVYLNKDKFFRKMYTYWAPFNYILKERFLKIMRTEKFYFSENCFKFNKSFKSEYFIYKESLLKNFSNSKFLSFNTFHFKALLNNKRFFNNLFTLDNPENTLSYNRALYSY
jgi:hypothetical protein